VSFGSPYVSVPVLSKIAVRHPPTCSSTTGLFMMIPRRAEREIEPIIATGIAMSKGQGVAITITARKRTASPLITQASIASAIATGV
jgi:hypothetical protein